VIHEIKHKTTTCHKYVANMLEYFKMTDLLCFAQSPQSNQVFFGHFNPSKETSCLDSAKLFQHNFGCHQVALAVLL